MYNQLYSHIKKVSPDYPEDDFNLLIRMMEEKTIPKHQYFLKKGSLCTYSGYVVKGSFRSFTVSADGVESITNFAMEDWWIGELQSLINKTPSKVSVEALEDSTVLCLKARDYHYLLQNSLAFADFKQKMSAKAYQAALDRINDSKECAELKYEQLLARYPEILQRIPQYHIASYLGITPESLSRLRKKLAQK